MRNLAWLVALAVIIASVAGAASGFFTRVNPYYDPAKPHHTPEGFANNYPNNPAFVRPPRGFVERWSERIRDWADDGSTRMPLAQIEPVKPDLGFIHQNRTEPALTWIGHATVLLQTGGQHGLNILTDPVFDERVSPVSFAGPKRLQAPGVALADLPHIDAILLSHSHYDHLSLDSLRALYRQKGGAPLLFAPLGMDLWLAQHVTDGDRSKIVRLDWWERGRIGDAEITLLPVHHWSSRTMLDRNETLWGGYALRRPGFSFFFSGDLGYSKDITDIAARFDGFDLAAIGIGAYHPVWYRTSHISPDEAVRIHRELKVKRSVAIHWGTYPMGQERMDQPPKDLAIARRAHGVANDAFLVLRHGQTWRQGR